MNSTHPTHTPAQKRRMLALARYLAKLPRKKLRMGYWQFTAIGDRTQFLTPRQLKHECNTAACGCGHAVMIPSIRRITRDPSRVAVKAFGLGELRILPHVAAEHATRALFHGGRLCTPKQLARDLRRYVKTGELPTS